MSEPESKPAPAGRRERAAAPAPVPAAATATPALDPNAVAEAMRQLMEPLAALAVARGVPFATLEDLLKAAMVDAARAAHPQLPAHRLVSRISTVTGLNRREVTRLTQSESAPPTTRRSPAIRVFTKWIAEPTLQTAQGEPMALERLGPAPSFEALAHSITRDVHPRSLLDELCRLGLAQLEGDVVHVVRDSFVPKGDSARMLSFLGNNVGDHLRAAVENVLSDSPSHLEQAVFADELSAASVTAFNDLMRTQWKAVLATAVPALQSMIDTDRSNNSLRNQRVRVGLYTFHDTISSPPEDATDTVSPAPDDTSPLPKDPNHE